MGGSVRPQLDFFRVCFLALFVFLFVHVSKKMDRGMDMGVGRWGLAKFFPIFIIILQDPSYS